MKGINIKGKLLDLSSPQIMGILNITPDSFYASSRFSAEEVILTKVEGMIEAGASIIDIGGHSTRPNAATISEQEEMDRVLPVITKINQRIPEAILSIDTFRSTVARQAIELGASIINDISGGNLDDNMFATVADLGVPYVLMHSRGTPETMSQMTDYQNLVVDVISELQAKVFRLRQLGVRDIIIDPGFGFAKNIEQNFELLANLSAFKILELPILVGLSRKSMIWRTLNITAEAALNGTTALNMFALMQRANVLRVHDVKEATETVKLFEKLCKTERRLWE